MFKKLMGTTPHSEKWGVVSFMTPRPKVTPMYVPFHVYVRL